ncbi:McrC family protein [Nostoc sp. XA010]|uniref:McrC family protein n=1 Tax=Nostoc sp. XA010 TaxID=2780407 RepID=UPI001E640044|nr:McrC family protein [Nostoc sp. XA010]MCC5661767.1 McrC family protein [Nostoc sp. XA010]
MALFKIISVSEASATLVEDPEFHPTLLLPGTEKYLTVIYNSNGYILQVKNFTGIIPARNNYVIQIQPKVKISDITYLLLKSNLLNHSLATSYNSNVPYQIADENIGSFVESLIKEFLRQIDRIHALGKLRKDLVTTSNSSSIKGKVDISKTIQEYSRSYGLKVSQTIVEQSFNTTENRLLAYCLRYILDLPLKFIPTKEIAKRLIYFSPLDKKGTIESSDIFEVRRALEHGKIPTQRLYYIPALNLALAILEGAGITIREREEIIFKPMIVNTADMFEKYIRNTFHSALNSTGVSVFDGRSLPAKEFYSGGSKTIRLKPDIIFISGGREILILDVKYKTEVKESDHYQMWAYLEGFDLLCSIIVSTASSSTDQMIEEYSRNNRKVIIFKFDLTQIKKSEGNLIDLIATLLKVRLIK